MSHLTWASEGQEGSEDPISFKELINLSNYGITKAERSFALKVRDALSEALKSEVGAGENSWLHSQAGALLHFFFFLNLSNQQRNSVQFVAGTVHLCPGVHFFLHCPFIPP